jgi:CopG family transcriptional regulator / antitoxin EndoAI
MGKRINIILPEKTIRAVDRIAKPGERSRFIHAAVERFIAESSSHALRKRLEATALRDRDLDREVSDDWSAVDFEVEAHPYKGACSFR